MFHTEFFLLYMYLSPFQKKAKNIQMFYCTDCEGQAARLGLVSVGIPVTCETRPAIYTSKNRAGDIFIAWNRKINP